MTEANEEHPQQTEWHRLFAVEQDLALTPVGIIVEAEFPAMTEPPKVDVLLLRQTSKQWTEAQQGLRTIWSLPEGAEMSEILTPERVMETGEAWKKMLLQSLTPEELDTYVILTEHTAVAG